MTLSMRVSELQVSAFPCEWPVGWERTPSHVRKLSRYRVTFADARDGLLRELRLLRPRPIEIVISTNIPTRRDGLPYASYAEPDDPAVAVYWTNSRGAFVVACDQWATTRENMRAVSQAIEAMRQVERSGATQITERAYLGFLASPGSIKRSWRTVFGESERWAPSEHELKAAYRKLALQRHPDTTGSTDAIVELNAAYAQALVEFS